MHGVAITKSGKSVEIHIGDKPTDPIFTITDLLPHLAKAQMGRKAKDTILGEEMNVLIGSIPVEDKKIKKAVKLAVLEYLFNAYGIDEEDLIAAEIAIVPAFPVRDVGLDRGLVGGYGQDDRICSYAGLQALLDAKPSQKTQVTVWIDREEIGSTGDTGADSDFIRFLFGKIATAVKGTISEEELKEICYRSEAISGDVTGGLDPTYKSIADVINAPRINEGLVIHRYSGYGGKYATSEASAEFTAKIMKIFKTAKVAWQSGELGKVDEGGGGTIAKYINNYGIQIIDCGPPILNMHSPYEIASKADLYATYLGYKAFLDNA
jgi:aspartyl aminopeptidase